MKLSSRNAFLVLRTYLKNAKPEKYEHSMRVAAISQFLAQIWGESVTDAIIAAMLHDIGKSMSEQQITSLCMRNNIEVHDFDLLETRMALHGKVSALLFEREFEGNDSERMGKISHAISAHVAGDERMNLLDKIIFIADNVESKTEGMELLEQIKAGQIDGPNECVRRIIEQKKERNRQKGLEYIPFLDATLEVLDKEEEER